MKVKLILSALVVGLAFVGCGKKSVDPKDQVKLCTKVTRFLRNTQVTIVTTITYDDRNRISVLKQGGATQTFTYNANDDLVKMVEVGSNGAMLATFDINYANGLPKSLVSTMQHGVDTWNFTVVNGNVTKAVRSTLTINSVYNSANDLLKYDFNGAGDPIYFTYTQNKNPFCNARFRYRFLPVSAGFFREDTFSERLEVERINSYSPLLGVWTSYKMDNDGFPRSAEIKATIMKDETSFSYTDVTYEYEMRDKVN